MGGIQVIDLNKKIDRALRYIDSFAPKTEPYYVCYSGGKDSDCIRLLCDIWGGVTNYITTIPQ